MNKELPSVEEQIELLYDTDSYEIFKNRVNELITQHTAELQRDNEQLKEIIESQHNEHEKYKLAVARLMSAGGTQALIARNNILEAELEVATETWKGGDRKIEYWMSLSQQAEAQLTEAQSQLIVLREEIKRIIIPYEQMADLNPATRSIHMEYNRRIENLLTTTQPTYDRIRQEWREEVIKIIEPILVKKLCRLGEVYSNDSTFFAVPMVEMWEEMKQALITNKEPK